VGKAMHVQDRRWACFAKDLLLHVQRLPVQFLGMFIFGLLVERFD
jgi:hypothetical protein